MKINHNDLLRYPNSYDERLFASAQLASDLGAVGIGATIYFGSEGSIRQIEEIGKAFAEAHRLGMFTVLWTYLRNDAFVKDGVDYHLSADLTGQANHLGVTIEADIIKQKQPINNGGYNAVKFGKTSPLVYSKLTTDNPIDLTPLAGRQLLRRSHRTDQLRRRVERRERERPRGRRAHSGHQQARRWSRTHPRSQGLPATDRRRRGTHPRRARRLPGRVHNDRLVVRFSHECRRDRGRGVADVAQPHHRHSSGVTAAVLLACSSARIIARSPRGCWRHSARRTGLTVSSRDVGTKSPTSARFSIPSPTAYS